MAQHFDVSAGVSAIAAAIMAVFVMVITTAHVSPWVLGSSQLAGFNCPGRSALTALIILLTRIERPASRVGVPRPFVPRLMYCLCLTGAQCHNGQLQET